MKQLQEIVHCGLQAILHLAVNSVCAGERREMSKVLWNIKNKWPRETLELSSKADYKGVDHFFPS